MRIALFTEVFLPKIDGITNRLRHTLDRLAEQIRALVAYVGRVSAEKSLESMLDTPSLGRP